MSEQTACDNHQTAVFHSTRYTAEAACEHCAGIIRHEPWCITVNHMVYYAYEIVADPSRLTVADAIIPALPRRGLEG